MLFDFRPQSLLVLTRGRPGAQPLETIAERVSFQIFRLHRKESPNDGRRLFPASGLGLQLFAPRLRQPVKTRLAVILRSAPFGRDRALLLQLQQDRIERALIHGQTDRR